MLVVERLVVGDARQPGVDRGPAELLGRDVLAGRGLHQRRAAEEDRAGALDDDGLVAHRRDVGAAGRAAAHDQRDLRDPGGGHPGLVVEDAAEVVAVREDLGLERQERAAAVDEVEARQPVLERDLLGAQVLLDRHRVVGAALDRRVVGDDHAGRALDAADAGDDPGARRIVVVQAGRGERAQLEEGGARVDEPVDPLADGELAALAVALDRAVVAAGAATGDGRLAGAQVVDQRGHRVVVGARLRGVRVQPAAQDGHGREDSPAGTDRRPVSSGGHATPSSLPHPGRRARARRRVVAACGIEAVIPTAAGPLVTVELRGGECFAATVRSDGHRSSATGASTRRPSRRTTSGSCRPTSSPPSTRRSGSPTSRPCGATRSPGSARPPSTARRSSTRSRRRPGPQRIASCEVDIDEGLPLFVAVATALGPWVPLPVT